MGLGTFCLLSLYPDSPTYFEWSILGVLITIPVSFISYGVLYMEPNNQYILFIQGVMAIIFWWFIYQRIKNKKRRSIDEALGK